MRNFFIYTSIIIFVALVIIIPHSTWAKEKGPKNNSEAFASKEKLARPTSADQLQPAQPDPSTENQTDTNSTPLQPQDPQPALTPGAGDSTLTTTNLDTKSNTDQATGNSPAIQPTITTNDSASTTTPAENNDLPATSIVTTSPENQDQTTVDKSNANHDASQQPLSPQLQRRQRQISTSTDATSTKNNLKSATSTAGTITTNTTDISSNLGQGIENQTSSNVIPSEYYPPLDSLGPTMTYLLSFVAMAFGITGATVIIRKPRHEKRWVPRPTFQPQEPLLEP